MREHWMDTYCAYVCEGCGTASRYRCGYFVDSKTFFMSVYNCVVTLVSHCVCDKAGANTDIS